MSRTYRGSTILGRKCVFCKAIIVKESVDSETNNCYHCGFPLIKTDEFFCGWCNEEADVDAYGCDNCLRSFSNNMSYASSSFNNYVNESNSFVENAVRNLREANQEDTDFFIYTAGKYFEQFKSYSNLLSSILI
ncbi:MAG: hypothetical protein GPJ51_12450 [Candidatus Heimdallarchaeota archaeon]|nr:hypothetical protein [Candidatus Heimdallarchaeota archaeon]